MMEWRFFDFKWIISRNSNSKPSLANMAFDLANITRNLANISDHLSNNFSIEFKIQF